MIGISLVFVIACSFGLLNLKVDTDPNAVWVSPSSVTGQEQDYFDSKFGPFFRIETMIFSAPDGETNLIDKAYLQKVMTIKKKLERTTVNYKGSELQMGQFCYKPINGKTCIAEGPQQYWISDPTVLQNDPNVKLTAACQTTSPELLELSPCMDEIGTPVMKEVVLGGVSVDPLQENPDPCGGTVPAATSLVLVVLLENPDDDEYRDRAEAWEKEVFLKIAEEAAARFPNDIQTPMDVVYYSERSVQDAIKQTTSDNEFVVVISYIIMFLYVSMALGRANDPVRSRFLLGLTGIFIVISSVSVSLGLCSAFGMSITLIVTEVVPFLVLAIGVDNMFIITKEFDHLGAIEKASKAHGLRVNDPAGTSFSSFTDGSHAGNRPVDLGDDPVARRLGATLASVGPSISAAAASEILAFGVGALTDIPALQQFCIVAAAAVATNFALQITWFTSAVALDARRMDENRYDLCPCRTRESDSTGDTLHRPAARRAPANPHPLNASSADDAHSPLLGSPPHQQQPQLHPMSDEELRKRSGSIEGKAAAVMREVEDGDRVRQAMKKYYVPYLMTPMGKSAVIIVYLAAMALGLYGVTTFELGLDQQLAVPSDFYMKDFLNTEYRVMDAGPLSYVVLKNLDYHDEKVRQEIVALVDGLSYVQRYVETPIYSWLSTMDSYLGQNVSLRGDPDSDCPLLPSINTPGDYYRVVDTFVGIQIESYCCQSKGICGAQYEKDIWFERDENGTATGIANSRLRFQQTALRNEEDFLNSFYYTHKFTDELAKSVTAPPGVDKPAFAYSLYYVYYDQYTYIQGVCLQNLMLAFAAVFLSVALISTFRAAAVVVLVVASIIVNICAVLYVWNLSPLAAYDIRINAVSVVNLVMAVGLSVEFCCHIVTAFVFASGTREQRARHALEAMGSSVLMGITLTKLTGVIVLAFAPSELFRIYYFRMYVAIIIGGAFEGLAFLPVMLSLVGPDSAVEAPEKVSSPAAAAGAGRPELVKGSDAPADGEDVVVVEGEQ